MTYPSIHTVVMKDSTLGPEAKALYSRMRYAAMNREHFQLVAAAYNLELPLEKVEKALQELILAGYVQRKSDDKYIVRYIGKMGAKRHKYYDLFELLEG